MRTILYADYPPANNNEKLWPILGHTVTITGETSQAPGMMPTLAAAEAKDVAPPK